MKMRDRIAELEKDNAFLIKISFEQINKRIESMNKLKKLQSNKFIRLLTWLRLIR